MAKKQVKQGKSVIKKCSASGCKEKAEMGSFCLKHAEKNDPISNVMRLSELEAAQFGKLDAEMRNALQGLKLLDYEAEKIRQDMQARLSVNSIQKAQVNSKLDVLKRDYEAHVKGLADRYHIKDTKQMAIDPDTGIIRDFSVVVDSK